MSSFSQPLPRPEILEFPLIHNEERGIRAAHARRVGELEAARGLCESIAALEGDARFRAWVRHVHL